MSAPALATTREAEACGERPRVLLIHPTIREVGVRIFMQSAHVTLAPDGSEETLIDALNAAHAQAMVVRTEHATSAIFAGAPGLEIVAMHGVGTDAIDIEAATATGVLVLNAPLVNFKSTAEHTLALLMAVAKNVMAGDRAVREGRFAPFRDQHLPMEIEGRSIFIIGLGRVGSEMARKCRAAFDMRVMAYDPLYDKAAMATKGVERVSMAEGYAQADIVSVHVPLKADTRGLIDARAFASMKKGAIFLNVARGLVMVQAALIEALRSGHLTGAGLDVFETEPVAADEPIAATPNVVLSPHYGGDTIAARNRCSETIARAVLAALDGGPREGVVNPDVLARPNYRLGARLSRRADARAAVGPSGGPRHPT